VHRWFDVTEFVRIRVLAKDMFEATWRNEPQGAGKQQEQVAAVKAAEHGPGFLGINARDLSPSRGCGRWCGHWMARSNRVPRRRSTTSTGADGRGRTLPVPPVPGGHQAFPRATALAHAAQAKRGHVLSFRRRLGLASPRPLGRHFPTPAHRHVARRAVVAVLLVTHTSLSGARAQALEPRPLAGGGDDYGFL
jgi:hypothetical protein